MGSRVSTVAIQQTTVRDIGFTNTGAVKLINALSKANEAAQGIIKQASNNANSLAMAGLDQVNSLAGRVAQVATVQTSGAVQLSGQEPQGPLAGGLANNPKVWYGIAAALAAAVAASILFRKGK